jgi:hypothetical protein
MRGSVGENADVAVAMKLAEFEQFFLDRGGILRGFGEHQAARRRRIDTVRFHREVVIVAHDKRHEADSLSRHTLHDAFAAVIVCAG